MNLFISPPFGNYINLPYTTSIKGSFTLEKRNGLFSQIFKTLRYSFKMNGWINKIGLRNKGINWAINKYNSKSIFNSYRNSIISIAIMKEEEIDEFLNKIPKRMNLELNISCPNTDEKLIQNNLHKFLNNERKWCSIKLSPHTKMELIDDFYSQGFRKFHCCNTLPISRGGLSGIKLIPYVCTLTKQIKTKYPDCEVISGGGIRNIETLEKYKSCGADHFSVSTILFNPFLFGILYVKFIFKNYE